MQPITISGLEYTRKSMQPFFYSLLLSIAMYISHAHALPSNDDDREFFQALVHAALERTQHTVTYNGSYRKISYPMGDVPEHIGVCTDLIIRSYRAVGIDLQQRVHEDMVSDFAAYPQYWGLTEPDSNIDHRRVPNLQSFFTRHGRKLTVSRDEAEYQPGDLVTWMLPGNLPHIGIVSDQISEQSRRPLIVHNIGLGPKLEDMLFKYKITGHYRFKPSN